MKKYLVLILTFLSSLSAFSQYDDEYKMEIGAGLGMTSYVGDFNSSIVKDMQPSFSAVLRRVFNPYMGLKLNLLYGKMKGSSADVDTYYPDYASTPYEFDNTMVDLSLTYEYNFFPYGTGHDYRGAKRFTPFLFLGLGGTFVDTGDKSVFTANLPLGAGVKYKLGRRLNLTLEWAMHFSMSDKLDGVQDPYKIKSTGMFKNKDAYSTLQLMVTYSFMPKCTTCNKD